MKDPVQVSAVCAVSAVSAVLAVLVVSVVLAVLAVLVVSVVLAVLAGSRIHFLIQGKEKQSKAGKLSVLGCFLMFYDRLLNTGKLAVKDDFGT
ncbi:MAG: hypothetical protein IJ239_04240 [Eubacterium sp.]|nr:hypothetical protein [Eubacterium sp.]